MAISTGWKMSGGETLSLAKSLRGDMETSDTLTGSTPSVTVWQKQGGAWANVTSSKGFTVDGEAVNTAVLTDENGDSIAVGDAVEFRLTAGSVGSYRVRIQCATSGGDTPVAEVPLTVGETTTPS